MSSILSALAFGAALLPVSVLAQSSPTVFSNDRPFTVSLPIDANIFYNSGDFSVGILGIFETRNTYAYTNVGTISATLGMSFHTVEATGNRYPARSIENAQNGTISAFGLPALIPFFPEGQPYTFGDGGYLSLSATNIINRGSLSVSFAGDLLVEGTSVDLRRSSLITGSRSFAETGQHYGFPNPTPNVWYYAPPLGVINHFWVADEEISFDVASLAVTEFVDEVFPTPDGPVTVTRTNATVDVDFYASNSNPVPDPPADAGGAFINGIAETFIRTNAVNATNHIVDAIFVVSSNPEVFVSASLNFPMSVTFGALTTNNADSSADLDLVRIAETYTRIPTNIYHTDVISPATLVPRNFIVSRLPSRNIPVPREVRQFVGQELEPRNPLSRSNILFRLMNRGGTGDNHPFRDDLFTTGYFTNFPPGNWDFAEQGVTTNFAAYSFSVNHLPSRLPLVPGFVSPTNSAGRVRINADDLDLRDTRVRALGTAVVKARNIRTTPNTSIAAPAVWYDLASTNGTLVYQGLNPINQPGLSGTVKVFTTSWIATAEFPDPNSADTNSTQNVTVQSTFRVMFVHADFDTFASEGNLSFLKLSATNLIVNDPITYTIPDPTSVSSPVVDGFAGSIPVTGQEQMAPITENWINNSSIFISGLVGISERSFPRLNTFNNSDSGLLFSSSTITLGNGQRSLVSINNDGTVFSSGSVNLNAAFITNNGSINANLAATIIGENVFFGQNGSTVDVSSGTVLDLTGTRFLASGGGQIESDGIINISFTESFMANNFGSGSPLLTFHSPVGIRSFTNPVENNFGGVNLSLEAGRFQNAFLAWPGADVGTEQAGFVNNSAVAALTLEIDEFAFIEITPSVNTPAALYVRRLELGTGFNEFITNGVVDFVGLSSVLDIAPGMRVYYNTVSVDGKDINPTLLDGAYDGRLRLISDPSVAGGSLNFDLGGGFSVSTSWGVRYSTVLDSDGDGTPNASDASPFSGALVSTKVTELNGRPYFEISWNAAGNTSYDVLSKDGTETPGSWSRIGGISNSTGAPKALKFYDPMDTGSGAKTYRVVYRP